MSSITTRIKPAARLISTIGEDLIGDVYAAIAELVKNAYDADSTQVDITFKFSKDSFGQFLKIEIEDNGHGMTEEIVLNNWLVPATKNKEILRMSPRGRQLQGRKGIGRYAAAILGEKLVLETRDLNGNSTRIALNWEDFETAEFLEDVEILVNTESTNLASGTAIHITATGKKVDQWSRIELAKLSNELRKLKSPFQKENSDKFDINLAFIDSPFDEYNDQIFEIEAYPIIDLFDYRISGKITELGLLEAYYQNNTEANLPDDNISLQIKLTDGKEYCGPIDFDFRVFDRDSYAISNLIDKGLIDPISNLAVGKREAKRMLDEVYGVNLYREGFRIRPYGNGGIDWLNLDRDRIQNPSMRIGNNQIVGFVNIKPEQVSNLEEKSARDGLKENGFYFGLVDLLRNALNELETRRFVFRQKAGKGRQSRNVVKDLESLFNYSNLSKEIEERLSHLKIEPKIVNEIASFIQKDAEIKSKLLKNIQNTIAIYQGQATLGKIMTVLLHEGRKPISFMRMQSPNLIRWLNHYKAKRDWDDSLYGDIADRLNNFKEQSDLLANLFKRLDPLSRQNKGEKIDFDVKTAIRKSISIFENSFLELGIELQFDSESIILNGWEEDIVIVFTNLIENSIYWLGQIESLDKRINIEAFLSEGDIMIHFRDNGPGIPISLIEDGSIFEPGFSKKLDGTGLGLPIAGEAIERLGGNIVAHYSHEGAYFTIEIKH